jgi:hypothetical protein
MQTILVYVYVPNGITTAIGEDGISGSRFKHCQMIPNMARQGGPKDRSRFHPVYVVNNFKFQISWSWIVKSAINVD